MKSMVIILLLIITSSISFAQNIIPLQRLTYQDYKEGYYYDTAGNKIKGLLQLAFGNTGLFAPKKGVCRLRYEAYEDAKMISFSTLQIKNFVIDGDSFTVVKNFNPNNDYQDFAQVLDTGKINLYLYCLSYIDYAQNNDAAYNDTKAAYFDIIEKNDTTYKLKKSNFLDIMKVVLDDYPALYNYIKDKNLQYNARDVKTIVRLYNKHFRATSASIN